MLLPVVFLPDSILFTRRKCVHLVVSTMCKLTYVGRSTSEMRSPGFQAGISNSTFTFSGFEDISLSKVAVSRYYLYILAKICKSAGTSFEVPDV